MLSGSASALDPAPCPRLRSDPDPLGPPHSLSVHTEHHAQGGVTPGSEVVPVAAHADGVQPVSHGEAPAAAPAPSEVKAAPGKGGGRTPEAEGPWVRCLPGDTGTRHRQVRQQLRGLPGLGRRGVNRGQRPRLGLVQGIGHGPQTVDDGIAVAEEALGVCGRGPCRRSGALQVALGDR